MLLLFFVAVHLCRACLPPGNDLDLEVEWVDRNKNFPTPEPSFCRLGSDSTSERLGNSKQPSLKLTALNIGLDPLVQYKRTSFSLIRGVQDRSHFKAALSDLNRAYRCFVTRTNG